MRPSLLLSVVGLLVPAMLGAVSIPSVVPRSPGRAAAVDHAVEAYLRSRHIPGMSVAIVADGQIAYAKGFGFADLEHGVRVTPSTMFSTASTLKPMTATAILRLVEQGRLDLHAPIQTYCPAYPAKRWPVTAAHLLVHQGGVRSSNGAEVFIRDHVVTVQDAVRRFADDSLRYEPGTGSQYSNAGYTLLACAIDGITGSYDRYLREAILGPAGMPHTRPDDVYAVIPNRTRYYVVRTAANTKEWEGLWTPAQLASIPLDTAVNADPIDPSWAVGAGNYLSTPTDMVRFAAALMDGRILGAAALADSRRMPTTSTGKATTRTLGAWVMVPWNDGQAYCLAGSTWNGSFSVCLVPQRHFAVAIASNVEFDYDGPEELSKAIATAWGRMPGSGQ